MTILILPGNAIVNKEWVSLLKKRINKLDKVQTIEYSHWKESKDLINLDTELKKLKGSYYMIIAKSAGIILALKGIIESRIIAKKCVFIGTPVSWAEDNSFQLLKYLSNYNLPTLFIQNKNDPTCSSDKLKDILNTKRLKTYKVVEHEGDSHDYDVDNIIKEIELF